MFHLLLCAIHMSFKHWISLILIQIGAQFLFWFRFIYDVSLVANGVKVDSGGWDLDSPPTLNFFQYGWSNYIRLYLIPFFFFSLVLKCVLDRREIYVFNLFTPLFEKMGLCKKRPEAFEVESKGYDTIEDDEPIEKDK